MRLSRGPKRRIAAAALASLTFLALPSIAHASWICRCGEPLFLFPLRQ